MENTSDRYHVVITGTGISPANTLNVFIKRVLLAVPKVVPQARLNVIKVSVK